MSFDRNEFVKTLTTRQMKVVPTVRFGFSFTCYVLSNVTGSSNGKDAAATTVSVEYAKSSRTKCTTCDKPIEKVCVLCFNLSQLMISTHLDNTKDCNEKAGTQLSLGMFRSRHHQQGWNENK
jgi:hypothetical protein